MKKNQTEQQGVYQFEGLHPMAVWMLASRTCVTEKETV